MAGWDVQKQNACFPCGVGPLLSPAFVHKKKKKKRFQIEILDFNCRLCCLQLTLMLQMKPFEEISLLTACLLKHMADLLKVTC